VIKEWCEKCQGNGQRYAVLERKCESCQGKGWVHLEPVITAENESISNYFYNEYFDDVQYEVFVREVK